MTSSAEYMRKWHEAHPNYRAEWRARNVDKARQSNRAWRARQPMDKLRAKDPERKRVQARARYHANRQRRLEQMVTWRAAHPEYHLTWKHANGERVRHYSAVSDAKRRGLLRRLDGHFTRGEWDALVRAANGRCFYCDRAATLTRDHRTPLSRGGSNLIENIAAACRPCNSAKGTRTEAEFRAARA